jgi:hypothetical protein
MVGEKLAQGVESGSEKFETITDFIDPTRIIPPEYQYEINCQRRTHKDLNYPHSEVWSGAGFIDNNIQSDKLKNAITFLEKHLLGNNLVDLGAGYANTIQLLCKKLGVNTYVKVDDFYQIRPKKAVEENIPSNESNVGDLHIIEAKADMLSFVTLMKDNSGNFVLNGVDECVIPSKEYTLALVNELVRATHLGGIIFGLVSTEIEKALEIIACQDNSPLVKLDLRRNIGVDTDKYYFPPGSFVFIKK